MTTRKLPTDNVSVQITNRKYCRSVGSVGSVGVCWGTTRKLPTDYVRNHQELQIVLVSSVQ